MRGHLIDTLRMLLEYLGESYKVGAAGIPRGERVEACIIKLQMTTMPRTRYNYSLLIARCSVKQTR